MAVSKNRIEKNLATIRANIEAACRPSRRSPKDVSVIAVVKTVDLETTRNVIDAGLTELAESRVQQLCERAVELGEQLARRRSELPAPVRWHMIGHLQRNKVRQALEAATMIHSVDSLRLAEEIDQRGQKLGRPVEVLMQVNCSQESQKFGVAVGAATHLAELMRTLAHVRLVGLMTMAPLTSDPEQARPVFVRLREIFEEIRHDQLATPHFKHLSMGMSQDYAVAVEEGATMVRIGTALFA